MAKPEATPSSLTNAPATPASASAVQLRPAPSPSAYASMAARAVGRPPTPHDIPPRPAVPTAKALPKEPMIPISAPLPPPRLNLCDRAKQHLTALLNQCLKEAFLERGPWPAVLLEVALQIAADIPFVVDVLSAQHMAALRRMQALEQQHGRTPTSTSLPSANGSGNGSGNAAAFIATTTGNGPGSGWRRKVQLPRGPSHHHEIKIVTRNEGRPEDSYYIPGPTFIEAEDEEQALPPLDNKPLPVPPAIPIPTSAAVQPSSDEEATSINRRLRQALWLRTTTPPPTLPSPPTPPASTNVTPKKAAASTNGSAPSELPPLPADPRLMDLGGTVVLCGPSERELSKVEKIMDLIIFCVCSLKLEMNLFRDHFVEFATVSAIDEHSHNLYANHTHHPSLGRRSDPSGLVGSGGVVGVGFNLRNGGGVIGNVRPRPHSTHIGANLHALWSWIKGRLDDHDDDSDGNSTDAESVAGSAGGGGDVIDGFNRFDRAVRQIESTVISTSPDVVLVPPHLLLRLRDEEFREKMEREGILEPPSNGNGGSGFETPRRAGSFSSSQGSSVQTYVQENPARRSSNYRAASKTASHSSKLSSDSKAGLQYYMTNNNSLSGIVRHQSLTFSYSFFWTATSAIPCQPPKILTVEYYRKDGEYEDKTLGEYVELLCGDDGRRHCPDPGCGRPMAGHVITYTHNVSRISVTVETCPAQYGTLPEPWEEGGGRVHVWATCRECGSRTDVVPLSDAGWRYSFGKYLELVCYDRGFFKPTTCSHAVSKSSLRRWFRLGSRCVIMDYEDVELFEMRVPVVQVLPEHVVMRRVGSDSMVAGMMGDGADSGIVIKSPVSTMPPLPTGEDGQADDGLPLPFGLEVVADKMLEDMRLEVGYFYGSLRDHIRVLELATGADAVARDMATPAQIKLQGMLIAMGKVYAEEERVLMDMVREYAVKPEKINNIRRALRENVAKCVVVVEEWQKAHAPTCKVKPLWNFPEFYGNKLNHIFPDSFVVIREDEPTSILAFTLTSREYLNEVSRLEEEHAHVTTPVDPSPTAFNGPGFSSANVSPGSASPTLLANGVPGPAAAAAALTAAATAAFDAARWEGQDEYRTVVKAFTHEQSPHASKQHVKLNDQLVIKQLASNWTLVEKDALLKFAPKYFEYILNNDNKPSVLAKIFGFYTIKQRNLATGVTTELDVLVMEHLFANVKISRKFDLKGVPDRHSVPKRTASNSSSGSILLSNGSPISANSHTSGGNVNYVPGTPTSASTPIVEDFQQVFWDGDWVDGRYRSLLMLHGHSKKIILDSVLNDTKFLSSVNVMDYSLLVGVSDERKQLIVGIVDFIGPYTWYKRMETRGKVTLRGGKECTVLPPEQYGERFRKAMDQYFLMVPDKWIKVREGEGKGEWKRLPPVL
ncbi:hypothetical protein HK101_000901 [Irineochytrium annulatum]|nr:hypothetical protein HK101_000901 [Irineochytrium annulatum]